MLEPVVGIYWAGKLFIVLALSVIISGGVFLNYTIYQRITPFSLLLHSFMFNYTLSMGFMNFTMGLGLVLWGFAFWLRYHQHHIKFYVSFALYSLMLFFCHVFGLFLLGLLIGLYQLSLDKKSTIKEFFKASFYATLKVLSFTIIPMLITLYISKSESGVGFPLNTGYGESLIVHFLAPYVTPLMFEISELSTIAITLFIVLIILKKIEFKYPFVVTCLFVLAFCVPFQVMGVACVNERIPALLGLLFAASVTLKGNTKQITVCSVLILCFCVVFYINSIYFLYNHNLYVSEFVKTIKDNPQLKGKKLLTVNDKNDVHSQNFSSYAAIEADMLVPELMMYVPPIYMYKKYLHIYGCQASPISSKKLNLSAAKIEKMMKVAGELPDATCPKEFYWKNWRQDFDFIFWIHFDNKPKNVPAELTPYKQGSFFTIYRIKHTDL